MRKRAIVLGSTGSIGLNTLRVLQGMAEDWEVVGLAAASSADLMVDQAREFSVQTIAMGDPQAAARVDAELDGSVRVLAGPDALAELVDSVECDCIVSAVVGVGGLAATIRAAELGRRIALASKEALVVAGSVIMPLVNRTQAEIIPVDSEHSGIFQALQAGCRADLSKVYLTASGGPFRTWSAEKMADITVAQALKHPTWEMGPKITIDSATMMNKALEIVEARWLFDLSAEQIGVVVHPESIIHSLVEYRDGSIVAQLAQPDMRSPIQYALTYPHRLDCPHERLRLDEFVQLNLHPPDEERFPSLRLGREVARMGGTSGAVLNAANEVAVDLFQSGEIGYQDIARYTELALERHEYVAEPNFEDLLEADNWAREEVTRCMAC